MSISVRNAKAQRVPTEGLSKNRKFINAGGKNKRFDVFNYSQSARFGQSKCVKCGSDYMKYASANGFCQDCQQRCEFIIREHPHIARNARNQKSETMR